MKVEKQALIGKANPKTAVKAYRECPGDFTLAANAAAHYAKKEGVEMIVVPGNSYMHNVFHIARHSDSLSKYVPGLNEVIGGVVTPSGDVYRALLSKK